MDNFNIIGISIETTNQNRHSLSDLERLWGKFWGENIQDQIPNKVSNEIYAVYTDYENGDAGKYTVIIGLPVKSLDDIPSDFIGREIFVGKNQRFVSKGKMPDAVVKTWTKIWQNKTVQRAYRTDVTVHGKKYYDGDNAEVETFISVVE